MQKRITDDLEALVQAFPDYIAQALQNQAEMKSLIEVVMDLGRRPKAYYPSGQVILSETEISESDLDAVVDQIGEFMGDNRAGIERTLHRISCIRNRQGKIIGLTCRVGRAVFGTVDIVQDLLESGKSVLLLGRPGVGKTTLLREAARVLGETKRVIVVDTSNEIAGDGDIPHPAIGSARRMQVPRPELQHHVMIEAVENHTPEAIIIDEIGRLEEAEAARTIAERGVQLIGTAHGKTLDNLLVNPILADLVGGIDSVTLSDEEARRRSTQKTVLERRSPPTFDIMVEIQDHNTLAVHHDVARAVDDLLRGRPVAAEIRQRTADGDITHSIDTRSTARIDNRDPQDTRPSRPDRRRGKQNGPADRISTLGQAPVQHLEDLEAELEEMPLIKPVNAFAYGANQSRLRQIAKTLLVPLILVDELETADVLITLKSHYRKRPQPILEAETNGIPLYVLRSNAPTQIEACLADIFSLAPQDIDPFAVAMREAQQAIKKIQQGQKSIELNPQRASIRKKQHALARRSKLASLSLGEDPNRRVRIFRTND